MVTHCWYPNKTKVFDLQGFTFADQNNYAKYDIKHIIYVYKLSMLVHVINAYSRENVEHKSYVNPWSYPIFITGHCDNMQRLPLALWEGNPPRIFEFHVIMSEILFISYCVGLGHETREQFHKFHNAPVSYSTMHHSEQSCAHFCSEWCIVGYGIGGLWDSRRCIFSSVLIGTCYSPV